MTSLSVLTALNFKSTLTTTQPYFHEIVKHVEGKETFPAFLTLIFPSSSCKEIHIDKLLKY